MPRKGFIFDLDGVVVDTAIYHYLSWKKLANQLGFDITEAQNEQLKGVSRDQSLRTILQWGNITVTEAEFIHLMATKNNDYLTYISRMTAKEILPGVLPILNYMVQKKYPVALGSASKNARIILQKTGIESLFNTIIDGNDVTIAKPNPEVFIAAAQKMNIPSHHCIVFEDSAAGIEAARNANMLSVGIGNKTVLRQADYIFNNFTEISVEFIDTLIHHEPRLHTTR